MINIRKSAERGRTKLGWLDSRHTFSFGGYYAPDHMGFGSLLVINEDFVAPGGGFPTHPHRDMEIITYVTEGALEHRDSMGTGSVIAPGDLQRMSAGTGVTHSEFNHSKSDRVHLLQIWIVPSRRGLKPGYEQRFFEPKDTQDALRLVASPDGRDGSLTIHQDASLYATRLGAGRAVTHALAPGHRAWVQLVRGVADVNGKRLEAGDGAAVTELDSLRLAASEDAEALLFDLG